MSEHFFRSQVGSSVFWAGTTPSPPSRIRLTRTLTISERPWEVPSSLQEWTSPTLRSRSWCTTSISWWTPARRTWSRQTGKTNFSYIILIHLKCTKVKKSIHSLAGAQRANIVLSFSEKHQLLKLLNRGEEKLRKIRATNKNWINKSEKNEKKNLEEIRAPAPELLRCWVGSPRWVPLPLPRNLKKKVSKTKENKIRDNLLHPLTT